MDERVEGAESDVEDVVDAAIEGDEEEVEEVVGKDEDEDDEEEADTPCLSGAVAGESM